MLTPEMLLHSCPSFADLHERQKRSQAQLQRARRAAQRHPQSALAREWLQTATELVEAYSAAMQMAERVFRTFCRD